MYLSDGSLVTKLTIKADVGNGWNFEPHTAEVGSGYSGYLSLLGSRLRTSVEHIDGIWPTGLASGTTWYTYTSDNGLGGGEVGWFLRSTEQTTMNSIKISWENPVQRKSPIAAKNTADKVDNALYLPIINDICIEIVAANQNYTGNPIVIGGKNLNTSVVSGNTTQKLSVYSTASQQLTTSVIVYKTGESPSGFSGTKDKIELIGGKQVYRINPSTLTLTAGTEYKARLYFRNSSVETNKYKEITGITL
jgi:hypothetical protein